LIRRGTVVALPRIDLTARSAVIREPDHESSIETHRLDAADLSRIRPRNTAGAGIAG